MPGSLQTRLKETIGKSSFEKLKDIYEGYSAFSGETNIMEGHELQKLMKDYELFTDKTTRVTVDLFFKRINKNKQKNTGNLYLKHSNV